jgi:hypothetical protein
VAAVADSMVEAAEAVAADPSYSTGNLRARICSDKWGRHPLTS